MQKLILGMLSSFALITVANAQPSTANPDLRLTAEDHIEIEQLMYRYGHYIDTCSNNGYDYADLYTEDAVFLDLFSEGAFETGGIVRAVGREELAQASGGGELACEDVGWNGWSHLMINPMIWATEEGASGRVYSIIAGDGAPDHVERHGGYEDEYVKTDKGWRIKKRTHVRNKAWSHPLLQTEDMN